MWKLQRPGFGPGGWLPPRTWWGRKERETEQRWSSSITSSLTWKLQIFPPSSFRKSSFLFPAAGYIKLQGKLIKFTQFCLQTRIKSICALSVCWPQLCCSDLVIRSTISGSVFGWTKPQWIMFLISPFIISPSPFPAAIFCQRGNNPSASSDRLENCFT